ncbi:MAG: DUF4286 family protein [Spirosomataceae bacterium]
MIIYNVTTNIDDSVHDDWLNWMKTVHIPDVMATGLPIGNRMLRLLTEIENGGQTYSVQYFFADMEDYLAYQDDYSMKLRKEVDRRYQGKYVAFRTLLEEVKQ